MDSTYGKIEIRDQIREQRRKAAQLAALQQQQLDALTKMDEAATELERVEREIAALVRGDSVPETAPETVSPVPQMTGERAVTILESHHGARLAVRNVVDDWMKRGWSEDTPEERERVTAILRHALARAARKNAHVRRDERGPTFYYWYVSDADALVPVTKVNGEAHVAHDGGLPDE
jgi:hypothetical protein